MSAGNMPELRVIRASNGWIVETYYNKVVYGESAVFEHRYGLSVYIDQWVAGIEDSGALSNEEQATDE